MSHRIIEANVSVGYPPSSSGSGEEWTSFQFHFDDFANLATTKNHYVASPKFICNGHQWRLKVYPGGDSNAEEGKVSAYLIHLSEEAITVSYGIKIFDKFGGTKAEEKRRKRKFSGVHSWGFPNSISRSDILDESQNILDSNGTLTIVVSIEEEPTDVFVPNNPLVKMIQEMFNDEATADVCFEVSTAGEGKRETRNTKSSISFYAHRSIIQKCAPMLAAICESNEGGFLTASVNDIKPEIFNHLLSYVYGISIPEEELKANAKDIIDAADKYSIVNLKLAAEAAFVESTKITFDNVMDDLLYADSRNCALLKEAAIDFLVENSVEATEKASYANFPGHLLKDVFVAMNKAQGKSGGDNAFAAMSVSALRRKLDKMGLEVDGSREAMIESIKSHS